MTIIHQQPIFSTNPAKRRFSIQSTISSASASSVTEENKLTSSASRLSSKKRRRNYVGIDLDTMKPYFHLPQREAAKKLGISLSTLKRRYYELNLGKWPYSRKGNGLGGNSDDERSDRDDNEEVEMQDSLETMDNPTIISQPQIPTVQSNIHKYSFPNNQTKTAGSISMQNSWKQSSNKIVSVQPAVPKVLPPNTSSVSCTTTYAVQPVLKTKPQEIEIPVRLPPITENVEEKEFSNTLVNISNEFLINVELLNIKSIESYTNDLLRKF
ncbi:hypothetical protein ABK040_012936 [Willaertia magna]